MGKHQSPNGESGSDFASSLTTFISMVAILVGMVTSQYTLAMILAAAANFLSGMNNLSWIGYGNYAIDVGTNDEKTNLVILNGIATIPVSILGLFVGGLTEYYGFGITFVMAAALSLVALWVSIRLPKIDH